MAIDFNTEPFFDDYNEDKQFYRILFRPGTAVQARELTQLQTILQEQIKRHGDHVFKEGAMIIPGQVAYDLDVSYVKLKDDPTVDFAATFAAMKDQIIKDSNGTLAKVIDYSLSEKNSQGVLEPNTLLVKFVASGADELGNSLAEFQPNEQLTLVDGSTPYSIYVDDPDEIQSQVIGKASIASVQRGVYYIRGHFVLVPQQSIILDKYNNTPSYRIGLQLTEEVVYPESDESLLDNALGSPNYSAPGAARYFIDLVLTKLSLTTTADTDFIDLLRLNNGKVIFKVERTEYSELEKTLARRTYDESGDYTLAPFPIKPRDFRSNDRGGWAAGESYIFGDMIGISTNGINLNYFMCTDDGISDAATEPTWSTTAPSISDGTTTWEYMPYPIFNDGVYRFESGEYNFTINDHNRLAAMVAYAIEPSKAYVKGYEISKITTEYVQAFKSRYVPAGSNNLCDYFGVEHGSLIAIDQSVSSEKTATLDLSMGSYVIANNLSYAPDLTTFGKVTLRNVLLSDPTSSSTSSVIGTARVRGIELHDKGASVAEDQYKIFLFDIQMNGLNTFDQTNCIYDSSTSFMCNMTSGVNNPTVLNDPNNFALIHQLPDFAIKEVTEANYDVVYPLTVTGTEQIVSPPFGFAFDSVNGIGNYILVMKSGGSENGSYIEYNGVGQPQISINGSGQLEVTNLESSVTYTLFATLISTGNSSFSTSLSIPEDRVDYFLTAQDAAPANGVLNLQKAYVTRLVSVMQDTGTFAAPTGTYGVDITNRYILDNGQHETHISCGSLKLAPNAPAPTAPIKVTYEYIMPSGDSGGKIFTVDSYVAENSNISYGSIPSFRLYQLRDCLDFRPYSLDSANTYYTRFMPKFGRSAVFKYHAYLPRVDCLSLNTKGQYVVSYGIPDDINPQEPTIPTDAMKLAVVNVEPYTFSSNGLEVTRVDNKRYTMRDIGKLERRIKDLEYYTSLSMLEADTSNMRIVDSNGLDRFQNGFLVDTFDGQGIGNTASNEWNASIDSKKKELRPFFAQRQVDLLENVDKTTRDYSVLGDIITLPIASETPMISQQRASKDISVNPYDLFTFKGIMYLNPWSDTWFATDRRPDVIINDDGQYNALVAKAEEDGVLGTLWNAWQLVSQGEPVVVGSKLDVISSNAKGNRFARIDTALINAGGNGVGNGPYWRSRASFTSEELGAIGLDPSKAGNWGYLTTSTASAVAGSRVLTIETEAVETVTSRTGKRTFIEDKVDSRVVDDKVVETRVIPYIRPRAVLFTANGLKPSTDVNGFFDGIKVDQYITRATTIRVQLVTGYGSTFDTARNCGSDVSKVERLIEQPAYGQGTINVVKNSNAVVGYTTGFLSEFSAGDFIIIAGKEYKINEVTDNTNLVLETAYTGDTADEIAYKRRIPGVKNSEVEVAFNHGEVIRDSVTGATAIVVGQEAHKINATTTYYYLHILNIKNGNSGNTFSTASGAYLEGQYTETEGNGGKKPRVKYVSTPADVNSKTIKTSPTGQLHGIFRIPNNPKDRFRTGVRELVFTDSGSAKDGGNTSATAVYEANGVVTVKQRTVISTRTGSLKVEDVDPETNAIITTNDRLTRDTGWFDPLAQTFMVQEEGGAFLSSVDLYFSAVDANIPVRIEIREVVNGYPGQVVLPFSRVEKRPADVYTSATGTAPTRFSFVSPVYVEQGTEYALVILSDSAAFRVHICETGAIGYDGNKISSQPYNGVFFKSQNASTWTAAQMEDLKFIINKAQFTTGNYQIELIPPKTNLRNLDYHPFNFAAGSKKIRVAHRNHGFVVGETVEISTRQKITDINGFLAADIFKSHTILSAEEDSYVIELTSSATVAESTGREGGAYIYATENYEFSTAMLNATNTSVSGTNINFVLKTVDHDGQSYFTTLVNGENTSFNTPRVLRYSTENTTDVVVTATLSSTNPNVSPILDVGRIGLTMVNNKVDSPRALTINDPELDEYILANTTTINNTTAPIGITGTNTITIASTQSELFNTFSELQVGNTVRFRYTNLDNSLATKIVFVAQHYINPEGDLVVEFDTEDFSDPGLMETQAGKTVDIHWLSHYNSEIGVNSGSVTSKYVTKKINLARPSEMLRIMMAAQIPNDADIEIYYKTGQSVDTDFISSRYYRAAPTSGYVKSDSQWTDLSFDVENLEPFTSLIVKIVMRSTNIAKVPRIKDFRTIACAA